MNSRRATSAKAAPVAIFAIAAVAAIALFASLEMRPISPLASVATAAPQNSPTLPPGPPEQPHRELAPDGKSTRIHHRDAAGRSPLAFVQTPEGTVQIQRTFTQDGRLLKEQAFLDGKSVPVPAFAAP